MSYYTGVGSRETPDDILEVMQQLGKKLADNHWVLRTGGAKGADQAFELGWVQHVQENKQFTKAEIYLPWDGYEKHARDAMFGCNILPDLDDEFLYLVAESMAEQLHPAWNVNKEDGSPIVTAGAKKMHRRNVYQVLGRDLKTPSSMLVAWTKLTKQGAPKGGTATAIKLATNHGIPCYNLNKPEDLEKIQKYLLT